MNKKDFKNLTVGETFQLGCRKFTVIEADTPTVCKGCFFDNWKYCGKMVSENFIPECYYEYRKDKKSVIFVEAEE